MKPKILELFAGSRSIGKIAEQMGCEVFSVDIEPFDNIDLVIDILDLEISDVPFVPDVIWASTDCTTYTIAAISTHRNGTEPKTDYAVKCDAVNRHVLSLVAQWQAVNPKLIYWFENPVGMLRKMPFMQPLNRATVWYCQYGDTRAKPTDIWSNNIADIFNPSGTWIPRHKCFNGNKNCHHQKAPRGSKTGTQGLKGSYNRSKIPDALCKEILASCIQ